MCEEMEEVRLFDLFNLTECGDPFEKDWLNHFEMHGARLAVHRLVQFLVDLIQGDASITLPPDINTCDGYNMFFDHEAVNLRDYIDFKQIPPPLRNFFAFIILETNEDTLFPQEWLAMAVDILHLMSNKEASPTLQVFAGYCCSYVLESLGNLYINDLGTNLPVAFVALCSRLCSAIFHVYEICLSSTCYSDLAKYFLVQFISETEKNPTLMCEENIPFYKLTVQLKHASMTIKIVTLMCNVLTSERSSDDQKQFMIRVGRCLENELSYHITRKKFPNAIRACLKLVVEMHKMSNDFTGFHYDHIYQNLFNHDLEIRRLAAQLFVNNYSIVIPPNRVLEAVICYHFKYETRTADNWQMLIDAFEQNGKFFDWKTLFEMFDTYSNGEEEAKACHVAVAICNVVTYQIKEWNSNELNEMIVIENLEPLFKLLANQFNKNLGTFHSKVFNSLLQIFDIVDVAHFIRNDHLKTEFTDMLKYLMETFTTSSNYNLATRLWRILRRIEVIDSQALNMNSMIKQICQYFTFVWENQQDDARICFHATMRLLVLLQNVSDLVPIDLEEMGKMLVTCRTAFDRVKPTHNTKLQAFVVNTYALSFVHSKVKEKLYDWELIYHQFADDIRSLFEWLTLKFENCNPNATFWEYMIFRAMCVLATYQSQLSLETDKNELINTLLHFLIKFILTANDCQSKDQARTMILTLAEAYTNDVPLPYKLFIVLNENQYFDEQFNEFIKALLPQTSGNQNLFYKTFATAIHRMAEQRSPASGITVLVKRLMAIVDENIPSHLDQQYLYTNVVLWVFQNIAAYVRITESSQVQKTTYNSLTYLIPLFERVKDNPKLAMKIRETIPIPRYAAALDANETNDLRSFYSLTESHIIGKSDMSVIDH